MDYTDMEYEIVTMLAEKRWKLQQQIDQVDAAIAAGAAAVLVEADEVDWHHPGALVKQLIERVLPVGAWFAPHDRTRLVANRSAFQVDRFAV